MNKYKQFKINSGTPTGRGTTPHMFNRKPQSMPAINTWKNSMICKKILLTETRLLSWMDALSVSSLPRSDYTIAVDPSKCCTASLVTVSMNDTSLPHMRISEFKIESAILDQGKLLRLSINSGTLTSIKLQDRYNIQMMNTTRQGDVLPCKWDKITRALCRFVTVITDSQKPHCVTYGQESRLSDALIPVMQENTETHIILSVSTLQKEWLIEYITIIIGQSLDMRSLKIWIFGEIQTALPPKRENQYGMAKNNFIH